MLHWCVQAIDVIFHLLICTCHTPCRTVNAHITRFMRKAIALYPRTMVDIICHIHTFHVCRPWMMSSVVGQCVHATINITKKMHTCNVWCVQTLTDVACHFTYTIFDAYKYWTMSPNISRCRLSEAHMLHLMHAGHDQCRPLYAHTTRFRHAGLRWYHLKSANIIFHVRICYAVSCIPWSMSSIIGRCMHATTDVASSMHTHKVWRLRVFKEVAWFWWTSFSICARPMGACLDQRRLSFADAHVWYPHATFYVSHMELLIPLRRFWLRGVGIIFYESKWTCITQIYTF